MRRVLFALLLLVASPVWAAQAPKELTWSELIPPDAMPEVPNMQPLHNLSGIAGALESAPAAKQEMPHAPVVQSLDGQHVRLPGYIVPLEVSESGRTIEFLLVPYFGACIHVPPPPPNQLVLVRYPKGLKIDDIYTPLWVSGKLKVEKVSNDLADAAYALDAGKVRVVEDADL